MKVRGVVLDIGGVLLDGLEPLPGAAEALGRLRGAGMPFLLLTNTTRRSRQELLGHLRRAGLDVTEEQLLTPALMARSWLAEHGLQPMLLIHPGLRPDFAGLAEDDPQAVVVGDAGDGFSYPSLNAAFRLLMRGAPLLSLSGSRFFREGRALFLDAGPFVHLLEEASGRPALEMGKPGAGFFRHAVEQLGLPPGEVVMVGDDVESDVRGACAAGLKGMLVRTGKYQLGDEARLPEGGGLCGDVLEAVSRVTGA